MIGYCVRCRSKKEMTGAVRSKTKRGQPMMKGRCSKCHTRMNRFIKR